MRLRSPRSGNSRVCVAVSQHQLWGWRWTHRTVSSFSSLPPSLSFLPLPTNKCLFLVLHPSIFMNWSNSRTRLLQQLQPLLPSWKTGAPGWCKHCSPARSPPSCVAPHPFLLHVMPFLSATLGSSSSDSAGGAGDAVGLGAACAAGSRGAGAGSDSSREPRLTCVPLGTSGACTGSGAGVSSTSECLPVVQGSIARNSSNVRTRGLQHFQPTHTVSEPNSTTAC